MLAVIVFCSCCCNKKTMKTKQTNFHAICVRALSLLLPHDALIACSVSSVIMIIIWSKAFNERIFSLAFVFYQLSMLFRKYGLMKKIHTQPDEKKTIRWSEFMWSRAKWINSRNMILYWLIGKSANLHLLIGDVQFLVVIVVSITHEMMHDVWATHWKQHAYSLDALICPRIWTLFVLPSTRFQLRDRLVCLREHHDSSEEHKASR